jgi:hypothetical protein
LERAALIRRVAMREMYTIIPTVAMPPVMRSAQVSGERRRERPDAISASEVRRVPR